jgi:hydroxyacylglutathione hydrolase
MIGKVRISGGVILDTRDRYTFMDGHIEGSLLLPLNKAFSTVAGSYIREEEQLFLIAEEEKVEEAVLDLIRIGLDNIAGFATPYQLKEFARKGGELFTTETIDFKKTEEYLNAGEAYLLDVRKQSEFEEGHIPGAQNIAHTRLLDRIDEIPRDKPVMVSCHSGARSAVASALLEREDFVVRYVDDLIEEWLEKNIEH